MLGWVAADGQTGLCRLGGGDIGLLTGLGHPDLVASDHMCDTDIGVTGAGCWEDHYCSTY